MKDKDFVQGLISDLVEKHFEFSKEFVMRDPVLFGDFRNALEVRHG